jgi:hypothetical protein
VGGPPAWELFVGLTTPTLKTSLLREVTKTLDQDGFFGYAPWQWSMGMRFASYYRGRMGLMRTGLVWLRIDTG